MRSGELRHRVTIQTYTNAYNSYREITKTWTIFATRWAKIESISGREYLQGNDKVQGDINCKIKIRYLSGVLSKMRVLHGSDIYEIIAPLPDKTNAKYLILMCKKLQD